MSDKRLGQMLTEECGGLIRQLGRDMIHVESVNASECESADQCKDEFHVSSFRRDAKKATTVAAKENATNNTMITITNKTIAHGGCCVTLACKQILTWVIVHRVPTSIHGCP